MPPRVPAAHGVKPTVSGRPSPADTADRTGTSRRCGCRLPDPGTRSACRSEGTDGRRGGRPGGEPRAPATAARMADRAHTSAATSSASVARPTASHGESRTAQSVSDIHMFPIPATRRWSWRASPRGRSGPLARSRGTSASGSVRSARRSGPSVRSGRWSSVSTGPFHCVASIPSACSTSHGRPARTGPAAPTRQRPVIRRWLRTATPPSKRNTRCFPLASTLSSRRPSTAAATPVARPRGWGELAETRRPTRAWSRRAARWRASPSGTCSGR